MKFVRTILVIVVALCCMSFTVVIDAGHGGNDAGAIGHVLKLKEKDLNLLLIYGLKLKKRFKMNFKVMLRLM